LRNLAAGARRGDRGSIPVEVVESMMRDTARQMLEVQRELMAEPEVLSPAPPAASAPRSAAASVRSSSSTTSSSSQTTMGRFGFMKRSAATGVMVPVDDGTALIGGPASLTCRHCRREFSCPAGRMGHEIHCKEAPAAGAAVERGQTHQRARVEQVTRATAALITAEKNDHPDSGDDAASEASHTTARVSTAKTGRRGQEHRIGFIAT
jgi:hypothetical protein